MSNRTFEVVTSQVTRYEMETLFNRPDQTVEIRAHEARSWKTFRVAPEEMPALIEALVAAASTLSGSSTPRSET